MLCYRTDVEFAGFRYQLKASQVLSHIDELWYNETIGLWMTLHMCVCVCVCMCVIKYGQIQLRKMTMDATIAKLIQNLKYPNNLLLESITDFK